MILRSAISIIIIVYFTGCSGSFEEEGKQAVVQNFNCSDEQQEVNLKPGKYVVRLTSQCSGESSIILNGESYPFSGQDLIIEIPEGQKAKILCPGEDGNCTLSSVELERTMQRDQIEYLPTTQLGDVCEEADTLIARSITTSKIKLFYSPCKNGTIEIRVLDETDTRVALTGGNNRPNIVDLWFNTEIPLEKGWRVYLKCIPGQNSEGNCKFTLGWK